MTRLCVIATCFGTTSRIDFVENSLSIISNLIDSNYTKTIRRSEMVGKGTRT